MKRRRERRNSPTRLTTRLSRDFFNLLLEKIIRAAELNKEREREKKVQSSIKVYGCWRTPMDKKAKHMGLVVNEDETKYLLSPNKQ